MGGSPSRHASVSSVAVPSPSQGQFHRADGYGASRSQLTGTRREAEAPTPRQPSLLAQFEEHQRPQWDATGPPVSDRVCDLITHYWQNVMPRSQVKDVYASLQRPENPHVLQKTIINTELSQSLPQHIKVKDSQIGAIQWGVQFASIPLVHILEAVERGEELQDETVLWATITTLKLLARSSSLANNLRRNLIRPHLHRQFKKLASNNVNICHDYGKLLGDDLQGRLKQLADMSRVATEMGRRPGPQAPPYKRPNSSGQGNYQSGPRQSGHRGARHLPYVRPCVQRQARQARQHRGRRR